MTTAFDLGAMLGGDSYQKYFPTGTKPKEVTETIEKALALYFSSC